MKKQYFCITTLVGVIFKTTVKTNVQFKGVCLVTMKMIMVTTKYFRLIIRQFYFKIKIFFSYIDSALQPNSFVLGKMEVFEPVKQICRRFATEKMYG